MSVAAVLLVILAFNWLFSGPNDRMPWYYLVAIESTYFIWGYFTAWKDKK
jgi:hypothetical protein